MRGREHDHRHRRIAGFLFGDGDADRGMRIDEAAGLAQQGADRGGGLLLRRRGWRRTGRAAPTAVSPGSVKRRDCASEPIIARTDLSSRPPASNRMRSKFEATWMSIDGEVVATTSRGLVGAGRERARQDVVDVGGDHQPVDRQAHAHGDIAGIDVAEIPGRHREGDLAVRRAERDRGGEVVDRLRHDARPVDRVDAGERHPVAEGMVVEQALHDRLAVVEGALDRERVDVVVLGGGHHAPLHVGDAAVREQHEHVGAARGRGTLRPPRRRCRRRSPPPPWCARRARRAHDPSAGRGAASPGP